ncbi:MAG: hypothetical protein HYU36_02465 [Planctomycetes bacterium]|nr:hypothetical protein [Planctomycetota bacterium]
MASIACLCVLALLNLCAAEGGRQQGPSFESLDKNQDGRVSPEEFRGGEKAFNRADANKDGTLTSDEWAQARGKWKSRQPGQGNPPSSGDSPASRSARFRQFPTSRPAPGDPAPDFTLKTLDGPTLSLSQLVAERPVVLEFGSYT